MVGQWTQRTGRLAGSLAAYYTDGSRGDRVRYLISGLLIASGLFHLGVQAVLGGPWDGPVSWRKPTTFGLSFGLTLATLTWVSTFIAIPERKRARILGIFAVACVVEVGVITTQAWRRVPSHFNVTTPLNAVFAYTAAAGGAVIVVTGVLLAAHAFRANPRVPLSMAIAVRAGIVSYLGTLAIGALMIAIGVSRTRTVSQESAYTAGATFKPGHAALMHGVLILPLLAWLLSFTPWPERTRVRIVVVATVGYVLAAAVITGTLAS